MCLYSSTGIKIAQTNIVVYKVLINDRTCPRRAKTPFVEFYVSPSILKGKKIWHAIGEERIKVADLDGITLEISSGFIHCFVNVESAESQVKSI